MPSAAANAKLEKLAASEASDNSPVRQVLVIIEHKIRNLEKRKSKLVSYRDLQKSGKELNADQKVAVAKYDEVAQTLDFARDLCKQVSIIATREAKRQAKKDARAGNANESNKVRDILIILDCLSSMGSDEARNDFLAGRNGAATLTLEELRILDDIYPEVTPKHDMDEEGLPTFQAESLKAAEHLLAIVDSRSKEVVGTTYARIKEIINAIHQCGYFDRSGDGNQELELPSDISQEIPLEPPESIIIENISHPVLTTAPLAMPASSAPTNSPPSLVVQNAPPPVLPAPAAAAVPAPAFPMMPVTPVTLQEVEHAYFSQQYAQQPRPITDVIGSQNFFFLQESELDSPSATPQPPNRRPSSPNAPVQSQTFTNQSFSTTQPHHYPPELRSNTVLPSGEIPQHYPSATGAEVAHGPPFPVPAMQINTMAIPRPLAGPPPQPTQTIQSVQQLPLQVTLPVQASVSFVPSSTENVVIANNRQIAQPPQEATVADNSWGDNATSNVDNEWSDNTTSNVDNEWSDNITSNVDNEWQENPEQLSEDKRDRPRGGDGRRPLKFRGGRGRGLSRGGPPRNSYQNGRNGNQHYRNGEGYQNGGGNYRDNNQSGGNYRENNQSGGNYRDNNQGGGNYRDNNQGGGNYRDNNQGGGNYRDVQQGGGNYKDNQHGNIGFQGGYKGRGRGAPGGGMRGATGGRGRGAPRGTNRSHFVRKSPPRE